MKVCAYILAVTLVLVGLAISKSNQDDHRGSQAQVMPFSSPEVSGESVSSITPASGSAKAEVAGKTEKSLPSATSSNTPSGSPLFSLNDLIYPGSEVRTSTANYLEAYSSDDPKKVSGWYKQKLEGYKTVSFSENSVNDGFNALLSVSEGEERISVNIISSGQGKTRIVINLGG